MRCRRPPVDPEAVWQQFAALQRDPPPPVDMTAAWQAWLDWRRAHLPPDEEAMLQQWFAAWVTHERTDTPCIAGDPMQGSPPHATLPRKVW
jgi:hypothetical protein